MKGTCKRAVQMFFAFIGSPTVTFREVEALEDAVHSSDDITQQGAGAIILGTI